MFTSTDLYNVLTATAPLYTTMFLAYSSMKWWKIFTDQQCSGINKFVSKISVPFLSFLVISNSNPYKMNTKLMLADTLQKIITLVVFWVYDKWFSDHKGRLDWVITGFSLSSMPNILIIGVPIVKAMYGEEFSIMLGQIIAMQILVWFTALLFLFEFRAATVLLGDLPTRVTGQESHGGQNPNPRSDEGNAKEIIPKKTTSTCSILIMVWKKIMKNSNTYACIVGLIWALISFRWGLHLPIIINDSISIMSNGGLGMATFSLGLFMAQSKIIACSVWKIVLSMALRFLLGPGLMAISSYALGIRGKLFRVAILQTALPLGIVPFVFAKEYNLNPDILSTGNIVGMFCAVPIALAYYFLLGFL